MKRLIIALALLVSSLAFARAPDSYQVTGKVSEVAPDLIVVMKGKEKFEIARPADDKTDVKVGDTVTVKYFMTVKSVEVKPAAAPAAKKGK
jgi:hypothetical protein